MYKCIFLEKFNKYEFKNLLAINSRHYFFNDYLIHKLAIYAYTEITRIDHHNTFNNIINVPINNCVGAFRYCTVRQYNVTWSVLFARVQDDLIIALTFGIKCTACFLFS